MAALTFEQIADIQESTLPDLDKDMWTDLSTDTREYVAFSQIMKNEADTQDGGRALRVNAITDDNHQAAFVGINQVIQPAFNDVLSHGEIPWKEWWTHFTYSMAEEEVNSADAERIVNLLHSRRYAAYMAQAKLLEPAFWSKPVDSTDTLTMYGIQNYIVKNATEGFNGGNPSGFTTGVVFDSTVQTRWANWTSQYVNVTKDDFVTRARTAQMKTKFLSPISMAEVRDQKIRRGLYLGYSPYSSLVTLAEHQNMNVGPDIAEYEGKTVFMGFPLQVVPQLESDTQNPMYGIDWTTMRMKFLKGFKFNESKPEAVPNVPLAYITKIISLGNLACYNRRPNFVLNIA